MILTALTYMLLIASLAGFGYAAWIDFTTWKIPNRLILALTGSFVPFAASALLSGGAIAQEINTPFMLGAGLLLFAIGFAAWKFGILGAGDAKLMFPIGLFIGWDHMVQFSIGLIVFAVAALALLRLPLPHGLSMTMVGMRIDEIRSTGKVPYGVVLVAALLATCYMKYL